MSICEMNKLLKTLIIAICLSSIHLPAYALLKPQPLAVEPRFKTIPYSPNEVFKFTGHYGYQSVIEFEDGEEINTISVGDSIPWQFQPMGSRLFLKPVEQDAQTNMTLITNRRTYYFELHAEEVEDITNSDLTFALRFAYSDLEGPLLESGISSNEIVPDLMDPEVRSKLNFNYSITGGDTIAPIRIFDDGEFTYFEFREINSELPAFYAVDGLGNESVINYRTAGSYIVVERVVPVFTLRKGAHVMCVFNENRKLDKIPEPEKEPWWERIF
jgi:type IV secretion system protein VirB9